MPTSILRAAESAVWQHSYNHVGNLASRVLIYSGIESHSNSRGRGETSNSRIVNGRETAMNTSDGNVNANVHFSRSSTQQQHQQQQQQQQQQNQQHSAYLTSMEDMWRGYFLHSVTPSSSNSPTPPPLFPETPLSTTVPRPGTTLQELFLQLVSRFRCEVLVWMHRSVLIHPRSAVTRQRLASLALAHKVALETLALNMLQGYLNGYMESRSGLIQEVLSVIGRLQNGGFQNIQATWLRDLAVEVGILMSPRQMLRSFSCVVADLTVNPPTNTAQQAAAALASVNNTRARTCPVQRRRSTRENRESRSESQERRRAWQEAVAHDLHDPRDFPERLMNLPPSSSSSSSPSSSPSTTVAQSSVAQSSSYSSTSSTSSSTSSSGSSTMLPRHPFWDMEQFTHWPITYGGVPASVCTAPQHLQGVCTGQHCSGGSAGASGGNPWHSVPCSLPHMHAPCIQPGHVATAGLPTHHQHLPLPPHQPQPTMPPMFNTQTQILQQQQQQQQQQHQQQQQQAQQQASFYPQYPPHPPSALSQQQAQSLSSQQHQMHSSVAAAAAAATVAAAQYQHVLQQSHQIHSRAAAAVAAATSSHLSLHSHHQQRRNEEDMLHRDQHNTQQQHHTHQQPSHHHQQQQQLPHPLHHPASHHHPHHPFTPSSTASGVSSHHHHHHHHMNHIPLPTTAGIHGLHQAPAGPGAHNPHQGPVLLQQPDVHATPHDLYHNHPFGGRYRRSSSGNSSPRSRRSWANIPGPPPPYPGFLIHFLAAIGNPPFPLPTGGAQNHYHIGELGDGDVNGDVENYEALLNLAERLGEAKPRGLLKSDIEQLPSYRYSVDGSGKKAVLGMSGSTSPSPSTRQEQSSCVVCMSDFEPRQMLRLLPCSHEFHGKCVDKWLKTNRTCPICRADGLEGFNNSEI